MLPKFRVALTQCGRRATSTAVTRGVEKGNSEHPPGPHQPASNNQTTGLNHVPTLTLPTGGDKMLGRLELVSYSTAVQVCSANSFGVCVWGG